MDPITILSSTVVAAVVAAITSVFTTRYSLKLERKKDRFDRLFQFIKELKSKITEFKVQSSKKLDINDNESSEEKFNAVMEYRQMQDDIILYYENNKYYFDSKLLREAEDSFKHLLAAVSARNTNKKWVSENLAEAMEQYGSFQKAFDSFIETLSSVIDRQLKILHL